MAAAFEEFGVMPELIKAVEELGWTLPTDIQAEAIPLILGGGDVMAVRAQRRCPPPLAQRLARVLIHGLRF
jgi:superfamily II DNA/RNA helicase